MSSSDFLQSGAILNVSPQGDGTFNVSQQNQRTPPGITNGSIDWAYGPIKMTGFVDSQTWDAGVEISVLGIKLGTFYGNLQQGLSVNVDIFLAKGQIKLYLKGTQVWTIVNLSVQFNGTFQKDVCIFPPTPLKALL